MTKYVHVCIYLFFLFFINSITIQANELYLYDEYHFIYDDKQISIYKDNIYVSTIEDAKFLDVNDEFILYNRDNSIWIYYFNNRNSILIANNSYNASIYKNNIIYESDYSDDFLCKNVVGTISYRNCYKLYMYNFDDKGSEILKLNGNDNYINDIDGDKLVYTSIHSRDEVCSSICSFVNVYDMSSKENKLIDKYEDIILDMSGNALIDDNIIYFESVPSVFGCNYTQIFTYNSLDESLEMISKNDISCFNKNSEILDAKNGYLLFMSEFENYENNNQLNYVYSYDDSKISKVSNKCKYNDSSIIDSGNILCLEGEVINGYLIDDIAPIINTNKQYSALMENEEKLIYQLEYSDNLSKLDNIKVNILDELNLIGEQLIKIELCDKFNNCSINEVLVNIIDEDIMPPKIYCSESITIKSNEELIITKYGFAIDNVDGKISIEIANDYDITKRGTYTLLIKSEDSNGNVAYKEIELIVYDNLNLFVIYFIILGISLIGVIIIYILRFKKSKQF